MGLVGRTIVLGVTGSIAAYKAADLASKLTQAGARVPVILTKAAQEFITPLTFRSLTHQTVYTDWYDAASDLAVAHVHLAETADAIVVAPATADFMAKMVYGLSDDPLAGVLLATRAPVLVAPAMDAHMYDHPATQANLTTLRERGVAIVGPEPGRLASGLVGMGRLSTTEKILAHLGALLGRSGDLVGKNVVVSAGPTEEPMDPVRHISNRSTGKMGFAVAESARDRGAS
ncbi:MAG: bifunctional phosphopantothenoylcysteine decarboxylase/phosphopantothenate--cysteine ligase CoaBC, partial [Chloroflexi bacterium]|nr:bifunctional phosphopantothenoylcysteine decarboxylase/phosphopantothenate--cysteine ligase CoaBC [Chloroflexota bacterium]